MKLQEASKEDYAQMIRQMEANRQIHHGDGSGPFIGPYENKPRGRVFYLMDDDRYVVMVGKWLEEYPDARELILAEFDLPSNKTTFEYAIHWDIGQTLP